MHTPGPRNRSLHRFPHRFLHHVACGAVVAIIGMALLGCSDDDTIADPVADLVKGLHDSPVADVTVTAAPAWCDAGHELDVIHLAFHEGGDQLPADDDIRRGVDAARTIETTSVDEALAADAATMADGLTKTVDAGSAAIFQEEPYLSAATNVFDAIEGQCST